MKISNRINLSDKNPIREILKMRNKPGMISLAAGSPAAETFPTKIITKLCETIVKKYGDELFHYGNTAGFEPLRENLVDYVKRHRKIDVSSDQIFISTGSQSTIDAICKVVLDPGDKIIVESPTFLGALKSIKRYDPEVLSVKSDDEGLIPEDLERLLSKNNVKLIYSIPTFQNPTGKTIGKERRQKIAELVKKYDVVFYEDAPYDDLRYSGEILDPIYNSAPENTVYGGSLSKIFAPGMRVGYYIGPEEIVQRMVLAKQGVDVHTPTFTQALAAEYIESGLLDENLKNIQSLYSSRMNTILNELENNLPDGFNFTKPEGGMFVWVTAPEGFDGHAFAKKAVENNVAIVPGQFFYADESTNINTFRLNFTSVSEENIVEGVKRLSNLLSSQND